MTETEIETEISEIAGIETETETETEAEKEKETEGKEVEAAMIEIGMITEITIGTTKRILKIKITVIKKGTGMVTAPTEEEQTLVIVDKTFTATLKINPHHSHSPLQVHTCSS